MSMKPKVILILGLILFSGCIQTQTSDNTITCDPPYIKVGDSCCLDQNENNICDKDESLEIEAEEEQFKVSEALDFCLKEYVYGKEGSWIDLANEHCGPLLPDDFYCMFDFSKGGTFGVLCLTSETSKELDDCVSKLQCSIEDSVCGDSDWIELSNEYCWGYLDGDCEFGPIGVYCLIDHE